MMYSKEDILALNDLTKNLVVGLIPDDPKQAVDAICKVITYHDWRYYSLSDPIIADLDYDILFKKLKKLEDKYPELLSPSSPTQRVAKSLNDEFETVAHTIPMLSLDNSYNATDLYDFDKRVKDLAKQSAVTYAVEPKYDGASIALIYENDILVRAATRGNGTYGDDITNNAKVMRSIPLQANFSKFGIKKVELRGEVVIEKSVFEQLNIHRAEEGKDTFQNARNTASGGLRMKDPKLVAQRGLEAFIYQVGYVETNEGNTLQLGNVTSHFESIDLLGDLGFKVPTVEKGIFDSMDGVISFTQQWEQKRDSYNYEIDGLVVKVNDYDLQQAIGATSHHPRWAMAYKFKAKQATSVLEYIDYQVGRTGVITPVAKVKPVRLAGVTISSISLHNEEMIVQKDIRVGDTVLIERAGDVIPYIVGPVLAMRTGKEKPFEFIRECPSCDSPLSKTEEEAAWRCIHIDCPAQMEERMIHFVSKQAMDISGLGKDIVKRFMQEGIIASITDIYRLHEKQEQILSLEGWKERSFQKLIQNIESSKENTLWRLITGLGIRHVGSTTAKMLAKQVNHLLDFVAWSQEELLALEDVGPVMATTIFDFFHNQQSIELIKELEQLGVALSTTQENATTGIDLQEQTFLFTGTLQLLKRDEAKEIVEKHNGKIVSAVSKKLDYLVVGENAGSKLTKAQSIDSIQIISEEEFLALIS